jgi:preprotein translocase subunit SecB
VAAKMTGIFDVGEIDQITIDKFIILNGPAIVFPFVREHIATVSMKGGMAPILLPPVNFLKVAEEKRKNEEQHDEQQNKK